MSQVKKCLADYKASVPVKGIREMLKRELHKTRHYRFLPLYLIFLIAFGATLFSRHVSIFSDLSPYYTTESVEQHSLYLEQFRSIKSKHEFYLWLNKTLDRLYYLHTASEYQISPIGLVAVRQMRTELVRCHGHEIELFPPVDRAVLPKECSPMLSSSTVKASPFSIGRPRPSLWSNRTNNTSVDERLVQPLFYPSGTINEEGDTEAIETARGHDETFFVPTGPSLFTRNYNFVYQENEFVEHFYLHEPQTLAAEVLTWLQESNWFDDSTKAIAIDTIHYDQGRDFVIQVSFVLELTSTVNFGTAVISAEAPNLVMGEAKENFLFVSDIATVFGIVFLIFDIIVMSRDDFATCGPDPTNLSKQQYVFRFTKVLTFWWGVTAFMIIAGIVCFAMQMHLWVLGGKGGDGYYPTDDASAAELRRNALKFYERVAVMSNYVRLSITIAAAALVAAGFKLFFYLQHVKGLNLITETLRYATRNLLSLFIIMFGMLFIYATAGTMIFGANIKQMRTFGECFNYMCRILVAQDLTAYQQFSDVSQVAAAFFFGTFFVFFWVMLLNMVLGIIAQAFHVAQEERKRQLIDPSESSGGSGGGGSGSWDSATRAIKTHFLFLDPRFKVNHHDPDWNKASHAMLSASVRVAHCATTIHPTFNERRHLYYKRRNGIKKAIQVLYGFSDGTAVTFGELCALLHFMMPQDLEVVFERAWALQESQQDRYATTPTDVMEEVMDLREDINYWLEQKHPDVVATMPSVINTVQDTMEHDLQIVLDKLDGGNRRAAKSTQNSASALSVSDVGSTPGSSNSRFVSALALDGGDDDSSPRRRSKTQPPGTTLRPPRRRTMSRLDKLTVSNSLSNLNSGDNTPNSSVITPLAPQYGGDFPPQPTTGSPRSIHPMRHRVEQMYERYAPEKLSLVDTVMEKFRGEEEFLLRTLVKKYGAEPTGAPVEDALTVPAAPVPQQHVAPPPPPSLPPAVVVDPHSYEARVERLMKTYAPEGKDSVGLLLKSFVGREEAMIASLVKRYGPEPPIGSPTAGHAVVNIQDGTTRVSPPAGPGPQIHPLHIDEKARAPTPPFRRQDDMPCGGGDATNSFGDGERVPFASIMIDHDAAGAHGNEQKGDSVEMIPMTDANRRNMQTAPTQESNGLPHFAPYANGKSSGHTSPEGKHGSARSSPHNTTDGPPPQLDHTNGGDLQGESLSVADLTHAAHARKPRRSQMGRRPINTEQIVDSSLPNDSIAAAMSRTEFRSPFASGTYTPSSLNRFSPVQSASSLPPFVVQPPPPNSPSPPIDDKSPSPPPPHHDAI